jgi:capsular polysaccharide biosynthesis protein
MPQVYESASKIQLGSSDELLIKKEEAKQMLLSQGLLASVIKELNLDIEMDDLKEDIKIEDIKDTNLLEIKVKYPDADMVVKINKAIADSFISQGQGIYQERLSLVNERLRELEEEIKNREEDIERTQSLITGFAGSSALSQQDMSLRITLLQNTLLNYESHLYTLKNRRNGLKTLLSKAKDFKIVESPLEPKYPIKPNKKMNVLISGIVSLMAGIFLAFFMEYWQSSKKG